MSYLDQQPRTISLSVDGLRELVARDLGVSVSKVSIAFVEDHNRLITSVNITVSPERTSRPSVAASQFEDRTSQRD